MMTNRIRYQRTGKGYTLLEDFTYYSKRYNRSISLKKGMYSDGATGFVDLGADGIVDKVFAWFRNRLRKMRGNVQTSWFFVHDQICNTGLWDDGVKIDNWSASTVAGDILWGTGYRLWSVAIWHATYWFGGGEARKNGMRRVNLI